MEKRYEFLSKYAIDLNEAAAKGKATVSLKGRVRTVFLPDALCRLIKAYAKKRGIKKGSVFVTRNGLPLERRNIWRMLKNLCIQYGIIITYQKTQQCVLLLDNLIQSLNSFSSFFYNLNKFLLHEFP